MSSLIQAFSNGAPLIWIDTPEPEKIIDQIPSLASNRTLFVFNMFDGLMEWMRDEKCWKIVLNTVVDPDTNEVMDLPIMSERHAWAYVFEQTDATFIIRNAHTNAKDQASFYSTLFGSYRNRFWGNSGEDMPLQIVCLSVNEPPPAEIASMCTVVTIGYPTKSEIKTLVHHFVKHVGDAIIDGQDVDKIVDGSTGLAEHEIIETYLNLLRTTGVLNQVKVAEMKFERLKAGSSLDIAKPKFSLADVAGLDGAKRLIRQSKWIRDNPEQAKEYGLNPIRRIMLVGISGCGKSLICEAAAHELGLDLAKAGVSKAMSKFVGESERNIRSMFRQINALSPIAVWIDEGGRDLSGGGSSDVVDAGTTSRVHGTFLTEMQELDSGVYAFVAANNIESLAPEMLRADRFDKILFVGFPSFFERKEVFRLNLKNPDEHDLDALAAMTPCFTGAEIKTLVNEVRLLVSTSESRHIQTEDILKQIPKQRNRIWNRHKPLTVSMYQRALSEHEWASDTQLEEAQLIASGSEPYIYHAKPTTTVQRTVLK